MKYYSDVLKRLFDSEKELLEAEDAKKKAEEEKALREKEKNAARAEAAKKVEEAMKKAAEANKNYREVLSDFCKNYGAYHYSFTDDGKEDTYDLFDELVKFLFQLTLQAHRRHVPAVSRGTGIGMFIILQV